MAKFFKSIFQSNDKRKNARYEGEFDEDRSEVSQTMGDRRKLSISRSGRLRQANKKRHSLSLDLYGENMETVEKPKSMEYHVHRTVTPTELVLDKRQRRRSADNTSEDFVTNSNDSAYMNTTGFKYSDDKRRVSAGSKSPDEEIDSAFEIIDKS